MGRSLAAKLLLVQFFAVIVTVAALAGLAFWQYPSVPWETNVIAVLLVIFLFPLLLSGFFIRRLMAPLRAIGNHTRKVMEGETTGRLMIDSGDELEELGGYINDIVVQQQSRISQLQDEKIKTEAIFAGMIDGIMVIGADGKIESYNDGLKNIIRTTLSERENIRDRTPMEVLRSAPLQDLLNHVRQTGEAVTGELTLGATTKSVFEVGIKLIRGIETAPKRLLLVFRDVTRLKNLERLRTDFVASLTHELKTPLTALVGFSETLLNEEPPTEVGRAFLSKINDNALRLNRMVDDLLVISEIEQGVVKPQMVELPLLTLLEEVIALLAEPIRRKGLSVDLEVPPKVLLWADRDCAFRIFLNVIGNAVKFTPAGKVKVISHQEKNGTLVISVADEGIGIPADEIPKLGERFYRVDKTRSRQLGGSGLGLSIVKHLLNLHRGQMKIESKLGAGTCVTLSFPARG